MSKRTVVALAVLLAIAAYAVLWTRTGRPSTLSMRPAVGLWPASQGVSWTIPLPDRSAGERLGLKLRQKTTPLPPRTSPSLPFLEKAMPASEADRSFGTSCFIRSVENDAPSFFARRDAGFELPCEATVQLLDLSEADIASTVPGKSLRVLARLSLGGSATSLDADARILDGRNFAGKSVCAEGTWVDGELYLMSFWVQGDGWVTRYDVLVEQSRD